MYIIRHEVAEYHQCGALYIIKPQERHTLKRDDMQKRYLGEFSYGLELVRFLVICLALLGVILLATLVVILFANLLRKLCSQWYYIRLVIFSARSAYHLRSKYHAFTHITRRKANITEKRQISVEICRFFVSNLKFWYRFKMGANFRVMSAIRWKALHPF